MNDDIINELKDILTESQIIKGSDLNERYSHIWKMNQPLKALALVMPTSTEEVSKIVKICNKYKTPIVPHGGLTNLVGGTETAGNELVVSLERMNNIIEVDKSSRSITVESGVILQDVLDTVNQENLLFPLSFGAKGSAQIGGIISTNAGGLRVFRYGMTRNLVLGLEAVLPDGSIISSMKKIIKDNSAYDVKQIFIGSEGTLGIITKAVLKLVEKPNSRTSAFVAFNDYIAVVNFLKYIDQGLAGMLSSFELIWGDTYKAMTSAPAITKPPLPHGFKYYVLLEGLGSNQMEDQEKLEKLLEKAIIEELFEDAVLAQSKSDLEWFWRIREDVHVLASQCTIDQHFDISLPIPLIGETILNIQTNLKSVDGVDHVFTFGHVADGNIHFIIGKAHDGESLKNEINDIVYDPLKSIGGSVSAEHGIGNHKKRYLKLCRSNEEINLMRLLKRSLDSNNLFNRGKVLEI